MNTYLFSLAKYLLSQEPKDGISKVRLAKLIYFSHKALVKQGLVKTSDLGFIRMPLGPVPQGFKDLSRDPSIIIGYVATGLSYTKQVFRFSGSCDTNNARYSSVQTLYHMLSTIPTSALVEASHKEPSWMHHANGDEYFIGKEDIELPLPAAQVTSVTQETDNQFLQARLVAGMLDDIVEESTRLEYPKSL